MKSFYVLELSVEPGGARKAHFFVYNSLERIQQELATDLRLDFETSFGLVYCYGEHVNLLTYLNGEERQRINLLPFITIQGKDNISFTLDEQANPIGVDINTVCNDSFLLSATAIVNWAAVPVLALTGDLLQPGEEAEVNTYYGMQAESLTYGFNDVEFGMTEEEYREAITAFDAEKDK